MTLIARSIHVVLYTLETDFLKNYKLCPYWLAGLWWGSALPLTEIIEALFCSLQQTRTQWGVCSAGFKFFFSVHTLPSCLALDVLLDTFYLIIYHCAELLFLSGLWFTS